MTSNAEFVKAVERLARQIAGDKMDVLTLAHARAAAQAQFDIARVRRVKVALIETMSAVGEFETQPNFKPPGEIKRSMKGSEQGKITSSEPVEEEDGVAINRTGADGTSDTTGATGTVEARPLRATRCSHTRSLH